MLKSDINLPTSRHTAAPIQVNEQVVFIDGSYATAIINNKFIKTPFLGLSNDIWTVLAVNVIVPTDNNVNDSLTFSNNCIVINNNTKDIAFCSKINIINIRHLAEDKPRLK